MKILLFGRLAERAGREVEVELPAGGCTVAELRLRLADALPHAAHELARPSIRACIDRELAPETARVRPGQEVAFLPPLSGG
jgi:molybdopterin synthase sulfur carrier subunit